MHDQTVCPYCQSVDTEGWWGNSSIIHCGECGATWTGVNRQHCGECHQTFSTPGVAGKAHKYPPAGLVCLNPDENGLVLDERGFWKSPPMDPELLARLRS